MGFSWNWPSVVADVFTFGAYGNTIDAQREAERQAQQQRDIANMQAQQQQELADQRAALDRELAQAQALQQQQLALAQLTFNTQAAMAQASQQFKQSLLTQQSVMDQMTESEKLKIEEGKTKDKTRHEMTVRDLRRRFEGRKPGTRDTILTSPRGLLTGQLLGNPETVTF